MIINMSCRSVKKCFNDPMLLLNKNIGLVDSLLQLQQSRRYALRPEHGTQEETGKFHGKKTENTAY